MRALTTTILVAVPAVVAIALAACGGSGGGAAPTPQYSFQFPLAGGTPVAMRAVPAYQVTFAQPVLATAAPDGSARVFVVEQAGRIRVVAADGATSAPVFLDITARVTANTGEQGLLGLAFDPAYTSNGWFYVHYTRNGPRQSVIARYAVTADPDVADPGSETILLVVDQPFENHNAGMLAFGPDDMLYVALGDGGSGGDPFGNGQDRTTLLGSMLRIDPHGGPPYAVPADNPLVGAGGGVREEIWAWGLRNPYRFSFDRQTGDLWVGDVGQNTREEVSIVTRGANLGWNVFEGNFEFRNPQGFSADSFTVPVHDYPRALGSSVTGGVVYRGALLPELRGAYLFGDFGSGRIWALTRSGGAVTVTEIAQVGGPTAFGEDRDGELLVVGYGGGVYRLVPDTTQRAAFPQRLSDTGLFTDLATLTPAAGLIEYQVQAPLWSDDAGKRRFVASPHGAIDFHPTDAWTFPLGAVLVKHFELLMTVGDPGSARRVETRVLLREQDGWRGYTYRWNAAQTDADLLAGRLEEDFTINDPAAAGGTRLQRWTYPSRTDCLQCHTAAAGRVLGVRTEQLAGVAGQLDGLLAAGVLRGASQGASYPALPDPFDEGLPVAPRARAYLAANCAGCHRPGGPTPSSIDLRPEIAESAMGVFDVPPQHGDLGLVDPRIARRGSKETSVLWERMRRLGASRMPPLGSHLVDPAGVDLIGRWIDG